MTEPSLKKCFAPLLATLLYLAALADVVGAQEQPEVLVELDRSQIYEGESVRYRVTINGVENPEAPILDGLDAFEVTPLGSKSLNSRSITVINGQRSETVRYGRAFDYGLTPKRSGIFAIPAPKARIDGRLISGRPLELEVVAPQEHEMVKMDLDVDQASVYPLQSFRVSLRVLVKSLPAPLDDRNPLGVQRLPPTLQVPWASDDELPQGIVPRRPWNEWLEPLQSPRGGGFMINDITSQSAFSLFAGRHTTFLPESERVRLPDKSGKLVEYWEFRLERRFTGERVGRYDFGPVTLKGRFAVGMDDRGRLEGEDLFVVAPPVKVEVKDVPLAGRPDSYIGAVGEFRIRSALTPTDAQVGDPLTLTLELTGHGTLDAAWPPQLEAMPAIADHFRIYDATTATEGDTRRFTYSLRPQDAAIEEFPAIEISYFDIEQGKYLTLHTDPIPLTISEGDRLAGREIAMASPPESNRRDRQVREDGLFANVADLSALDDQSVDPRRWLTGAAGLLGLYVLAVAVVAWWRRQVDAEGRRRRGARQAAAAQLAAAQDAIAAHDGRGAADHLRRAVVGLVADAAQLAQPGLTSADVLAQLRRLELPDSQIQQVARLLDACDGARYGGSEASLEELAHDANRLVEELSQAFRSRKLVR